MAAMTGNGSPSIRSMMAWPARTASSASSAVLTFWISETSAPARNIPSFAEVKIAPRRSERDSSSERTSWSRAMTARDSLFTFSPGRSNVTQATESSQESRIPASSALIRETGVYPPAIASFKRKV